MSTARPKDPPIKLNPAHRVALAYVIERAIAATTAAAEALDRDEVPDWFSLQREARRMLKMAAAVRAASPEPSAPEPRPQLRLVR